MTTVTTLHAEDEPKVEFKSDTFLVQVPVVVVDRSGNPVHNLKKEDFQITENGKEQAIKVFDEVVADKAPMTLSPSPAQTFSNLRAQLGEQPRSVVVIALDTVNTPLLDQLYGRQQLLKYLASNLDARQALGLVVISGSGLKVVHSPTTDAKQLIEALNKVSSENPALTGVSVDAQAAAASGDVTKVNPAAFINGPLDDLSLLEEFETGGDAPVAGFKQDRAIETTMRAFLGIAWGLSGIPGKKSIVWATGGMPFYLDSPSTVPGGYLSDLYEHTMAALNDAEISVYPVDVRGLLNDSLAAEPQRRTMIRNPRANDASIQQSDRSWLNSSATDALRDFADMTGGRAFYNANDISDLFKRAVDDTAAFYLLGYYLDTANTKPGWRQLKVKLRDKEKEKQSDVRARSGFLLTNATVDPVKSRQSDLQFAVISPFESTGLPLTIRWAGTSGDGNVRKVQFGLQLPPNALTLGAQNLLDFDYVAQAYVTKDGQQADHLMKSVRGNIPAERLATFQAQGLGFKNELQLTPGQYTVRFVVRDNVSGRVGSVSAPVTVN